MQDVIVWVMASVAVVYLLRSLYKHFTSTGCGGACSGCTSLDVDKIQRQMEAKQKLSENR